MRKRIVIGLKGIFNQKDMKMKKYIAMLLPLAIAALASCQKENQDEEPRTKEEILTSGEWTLNFIETRTYYNDSLGDVSNESIGAKVRFYTKNYVVASVPGVETDTSSWSLEDDVFYLDDLANEIIVLDENEFEFALTETHAHDGDTVEIRSITNLSR